MDRPEPQSVGTFTIAPDHPALAGHFPGNPLVPGVVLVDNVQVLVAGLAADARLAALPRLKFTGFVRPAETVDVRAAIHGDRLVFRCEVEGRIVAEGQFGLEPAT